MRKASLGHGSSSCKLGVAICNDAYILVALVGFANGTSISIAMKSESLDFGKKCNDCL